MFWQEKEFLRFHLRLSLVLVFAASLCECDHQKASQVTEIESCSNAVSAWIKSDDFEQAVKDRQFLFYLLDCINETHKLILAASESEDCKTFEEMIPSVLASMMNENIPQRINTTTSFESKLVINIKIALSFATKEERRILLAVYLANISHKMRYFSCLANLWIKDVTLTPQHKRSVEDFPLELKKHIFGFLDSTLMVRWKSDNITILEYNTDTLINMLIKFSTTLINLLKEIKTDIDKTYPEESSWMWSSRSVSSERKIIEKLDELKTKTVTLRDELNMLKTAFTELLSGLFRSYSLQTINFRLIIAIFLVPLSFWVYQRPVLVRQFFENLETLKRTIERTRQNLLLSFQRLIPRLIHRNR